MLINIALCVFVCAPPMGQYRLRFDSNVGLLWAVGGILVLDIDRAE